MFYFAYFNRCDRGFHLFCLSPPLTKVPDGEWTCPLCKQADLDSTALRPGNLVTYKEFESHARRFKNSYFGSEAKAKKVRQP